MLATAGVDSRRSVSLHLAAGVGDRTGYSGALLLTRIITPSKLEVGACLSQEHLPVGFVFHFKSYRTLEEELRL